MGIYRKSSNDTKKFTKNSQQINLSITAQNLHNGYFPQNMFSTNVASVSVTAFSSRVHNLLNFFLLLAIIYQVSRQKHILGNIGILQIISRKIIQSIHFRKQKNMASYFENLVSRHSSVRGYNTKIGSLEFTHKTWYR